LGPDALEEAFWSVFDSSDAADCADGVDAAEVEGLVELGFWVCGGFEAAGWLGVGVVLQAISHKHARLAAQSPKDLILISGIINSKLNNYNV